MRCCRVDEAKRVLNSVTARAVSLAEELCREQTLRIGAEIARRGGLYGAQAENIRKYCEYAKIDINL